MINEINVKEAKMCIDGGAIVLDVRTKAEYEQGHIKNSLNLDIHDSSFKDSVSGLDKTKNYLVYCASGSRSLMAVDIMLELGCKDAHSLAGGIADWQKEGMEVEE